MKIVFTIVSIFLSTALFSQGLSCLENLTLALNSQDEAQIFAVDVLVETENINIDDYVISIGGHDAMSFITLTKDDIGSHDFTVTNTVTSGSCQGTLVVGESIASPILAVCNDKLIVDLAVQTFITIDDMNEGSYSPEDTTTLSFSLSLGEPEFYKPGSPNFEVVDKVDFAGLDVCSPPVIVVLNVWDEKGNHNACWSTIFIDIPGLDCQHDFEEVHHADQSTVCGKECDGEKALDPYSIQWPITYDDTSLPGYQRDCKGLSEKDLGAPTRPKCNTDSEMDVPTWCEIDCGLIGYSYEDVVWDQTVPCSDVARLWTIIDWCTFDPKTTDIETNNDSYGLIEDVRVDACDACSNSSELYVGFTQVEVDGHYTFEQMIRYSDSSDTDLAQMPVTIDQINGSFDMASFGFEINGSSLQLNENGTFSIPESAIKEGSNILSLKTLPGSNALNGISTLDIVLGLQYVIGLRELTPEQTIAADLDKSGDVSVARDLIKLRNLILGNETGIEGEDWFIVEQDQDFSSFNGFNFENTYSSYSFEKEDLDMDQGLTIAIHKYGDLNNSHSYARSNDKAVLQFENRTINKGDELTIMLKLSSEKIGTFIAAQAGIVFQDLVLIDVKHEYGNEFGYNNETDKFKFVYNDNNNPLSELEVELRFTAKSSGELSDFIKLDKDFITEYITPNLELYEIELIDYEVDLPIDPIGQLSDPILSDVSIFPNPTSSSFTIQVELGRIGHTLNIYNSLGQIEYTQKVKSLNTIINSTSLSAGLKIVSIDGSQGQKLVIEK